jgi:hypothetical protein
MGRRKAGVLALGLAVGIGVMAGSPPAIAAEACTDIAAIGEGEAFRFSGTITRTAPPPIDPANLDVAANPPCDPGMDVSNWTRNPIILVYFDALPDACIVGAPITVSGRGYVYEHGVGEVDFYVENTTLECG